MTLTELKTAAASYLQKGIADLTVNGQDLGLLALNQVRRQGEMSHNFEFARQLVTVSVNGVTGGSLDAAVAYGTTTPVVEIKEIIEVGIFDDDGNLRPIEWTTVAAGLEKQRQVLPGFAPRYPTDGEARPGPYSPFSRVMFSGQNVYTFPKDTTGTAQTIGMEVYAFGPDWTAVNDTTNLVWLTKGSQFLLWQTVVQLNHYFQQFIPRQEGNLPPPSELANTGFEILRNWDIYKFEQFRRHE